MVVGGFSSFHVLVTTTVMHVPDQEIEQPVNCKGYVGDHCPTVKLEPTWTSIFLREEQEDYFLMERSQK